MYVSYVRGMSCFPITIFGGRGLVGFQVIYLFFLYQDTRTKGAQGIFFKTYNIAGNAWWWTSKYNEEIASHAVNLMPASSRNHWNIILYYYSTYLYYYNHYSYASQLLLLLFIFYHLLLLLL